MLVYFFTVGIQMNVVNPNRICMGCSRAATILFIDLMQFFFFIFARVLIVRYGTICYCICAILICCGAFEIERKWGLCRRCKFVLLFSSFVCGKLGTDNDNYAINVLLHFRCARVLNSLNFNFHVTDFFFYMTILWWNPICYP